MRTNKHVSKVANRLTCYLQRNGMPRAAKVANALLTDVQLYNGDSVIQVSRSSALGAAFGPTLTASAVRDKLRTLDLIGASIGNGASSWLFYLTPRLERYRADLELEAKEQLPIETRLMNLEKDNEKLKSDIKDIWDTIADIQANDPPVTEDKVRRHLELV